MSENLVQAIGTAQVERLYAIAPVGLSYLDTELRICHINQWLAHVYDVSAYGTGNDAHGNFMPDLVEGIGPLLSQVLVTGRPILDWETTHKNIEVPSPNCKYRYSLFPDKNDNGEVQGISCVVSLIRESTTSQIRKENSESASNAANRRLTKIVSELRIKNAEIQNRAQKLAEENTSLARANKRLARLALYDSLTGLGNRELFLRQLEHLVAIAGRRNEEVAILEMDLDGFKAVNDQLGHAAGDEVLREFGERLRASLRQADQKYRIGGDEFAVLLEPTVGALDGAYGVADQIAGLLTAPMEIKGHSCSIGISIGVAIFPEHGKKPEALLRKADAAMYEAKKKQQVVARASDLNATTVLRNLQQSIYQLIYVSTAVRLMGHKDLMNLMVTARARNDRTQITGMLLYKDGRFMEVLEGNESNVKTAFAEIEKDSRHKNIDVLRSEEIAFRSFPDWTMSFEGFDFSESAAFTPFLIEDGSPDYFAEEAIEAHAMLLAFKGVSLRRPDQRDHFLDMNSQFERATPQS